MKKRYVRTPLLALSVSFLISCGAGTGKTPDTTSTPAVSELIPRNVLFGAPDRVSAKLSPDGKHLSFLAPVNGVLNVWVGPVGDVSAATPVTSETTRPLRGYSWAHTSQHILYAQDSGGDEDFHVYSVGLATKAKVDLTPYRKIAARVVGTSYKHPHHIAIAMNDRNPQLHDVYKVDIRTGQRELLALNPGVYGFQLDDNLKVRVAVKPARGGGSTLVKPALKPDGSSGEANRDKVAATAKSNVTWIEFGKIESADAISTNLLQIQGDGETLYLQDSRGRNTSALVAYNLLSAESKVLAQDNKADAGSVLFHPKTRTPQAVSFTHTRQRWHVLDESIRPDMAALRELSQGDFAVTSKSADDRAWIVAYEVDNGPARYYHWNRDRQQGTFLFVSRKALQSVELARMHPRVVQSRDGLELVNYLTLPNASDPDGDGRPTIPQATVMVIHGGPWARDSWGYSSLHQLLANRGYAVMSVNYRGSTGFGKRFVNAGDREWAGKMHDDVIDSVKWLVENKIADSKRICIMGGSYGGYETLVGLTETPEVFACGVDIVGPSSLVTLVENMPPYWRPFSELLKTRIGDWTTPEGREFLKSRSPLHKANKIKRPLLIGQGANDPRVTQQESDQIVQAMKQSGIAVSYILFPDEGHGFARSQNRLAFFAAAEAFLSVHLGGRYQRPEAGEFVGTTMQVPAGAAGLPDVEVILDQAK